MIESESTADYYKFCAGEEHIKISNAICRGRRRSSFPKCPNCQFNPDAGTGERVSISVDKAKPVSGVEALFDEFDIRGTVPAPLTQESAWRIGHAAAQYLRSKLRGYERADPACRAIVIGRDTRPHGIELQRGLSDGIRATGTNVLNLGVIDTPQLYFAVNHLGACGGIQTTGGRRPIEFNGFEICGAKGVPLGQDTGMNGIREIACRVPRHETGTTAGYAESDVTKAYREYVLGFMRGQEPRGRALRVAVDASNGSAGRWMPIVFKNVKRLTIVPLNFKHDGRFEHVPDPLDPANLKGLRKMLKAHRASLGVCFDGDAARCVFLDDRGLMVRPDIITALLARAFLEREGGASIVYDHRSSRVVAEEIQRVGGVPIRERVGAAFMKKSMADANAVFGGGLCGRYYFRDNFFCESGFLALVHLINILTDTGKTLSELARPLQRFRPSGEISFRSPDREASLRKIRDRFTDAEIDELDGVTVRYPDWWFNVRKSSGDPVLRLNVEARTRKIVDRRVLEVAPMLGERFGRRI
ncbi:MAG: phosphomannomutase/phosphoglucomutase [Planctomycetota bacterium]|nr:phosphomannomutase/phosphoglucomutase [Planctomycetota bacterium]